MLKILSLFSGIGAYEKALARLDIPFEVTGYSEIDRYASAVYSAIHGLPETMNLGDITKINEKDLPRDIDLITYSAPCQDVSVAGHQKGLIDENGNKTRTGLVFDAVRIISEVKPKYAVAENVKGLVSRKFRDQFEFILSLLEEAGYNNYWKVLNAKDYGIPQNRERVFLVSIRKDIDDRSFEQNDVKPNSPYLFVSQRGTKMDRSTIFRKVKPVPAQKYISNKSIRGKPLCQVKAKIGQAHGWGKKAFF